MTAQAGMFPYPAAERHATAARNNNSGLQRKERGQQAAMDAESAKWKADTLFLMRTYVSSFVIGDVFAFEDFRAYCATCDHPEPHTHKVWGSFPAVAKANGIPIAMTDKTRKASSPRTNAHRINLWVVTGPLDPA